MDLGSRCKRTAAMAATFAAAVSSVSAATAATRGAHATLGTITAAQLTSYVKAFGVQETAYQAVLKHQGATFDSFSAVSNDISEAAKWPPYVQAYRQISRNYVTLATHLAAVNPPSGTSQA